MYRNFFLLYYLPMELKCAPNFANQVMEEVLHDVANTSVYLDNIGAFSFTWEHHLYSWTKYYIG